MKRNYAMVIINDIKSLIERNMKQISYYFRECKKFQKELEEILLKKAVVKRLKIERVGKK